MKRLGIIFFVASFLIVAITAANASYYNRPLWSTGPPAPPVNSKQMPHGGFVDSTNRCKDCHAVHIATGQYKLLQNATSGETACAYCHGSAGVIAAVNGVELTTSGHGLGGLSGTIYPPDDRTPGYSVEATSWGCGQCHSMHNNNTVSQIRDRVNTTAQNTNALLKGNPDQNDTVEPWATGFASQIITLSMWCAECHGANYGTYGQSKTYRYGQGDISVWGHDAGATAGFLPVVYGSATYAYFSSPVTQSSNWASARVPRCNQCHAAGAAANTVTVGYQGWVTGQSGQVANKPGGGVEGYFPHSGYSTSYSLLKNSTNLTAGQSRLDDVCNDCHYTPSLP